MAIAFETLKKHVEEAGLEISEMAAFYKVSAPGSGIGDPTVYIAKTKKVARVDIAGFSFRHPAVTILTEEQAKEKRIGRVRGQINFARTEEQVLEAFLTSLAFLRSLSGVTARDLGKMGKYIRGITPTVLVDPKKAAAEHTPKAARAKRGDASATV